LPKIELELEQIHKYNHSMPIQIRFSDLDALNHVNNSYHSQYFDVGRINYFEAVMGSKVDWSKIMVVIVHIEIDFLSPILQGDNINVETKLISFGTKSMKMQQRLVDSQTGNVKSICQTILSGFDHLSNSSMVIPEEFKTIFFEFEKE
jgi:acyl-CoA thioester hydrolase